MTLDDIHAKCVDDGGCLLWQRSQDRGGRPKLTVHAGGGKTKTVQPRRIVWEAVKGPIRGKLRVTVTCGNALCLNPDHMELITPGEVIRRTAKRPDINLRRHLAGLKSRDRSVLDMEKARYIRATDKTLAVVAKELGIGETTASAIRRNKRWKDYANPFAALLG